MNYIEKYADPKWVFNTAQQTTKTVDEYLKFVQSSFNTDSVDFKDIVKQLDAISQSSLILSRLQRGELERIKLAKKLRKQLKEIKILEDFDKYNKFDKLDNLNLDSSGLKEAYRVSEEIIKDIRVARNWIDSYKAYERLSENISKNSSASIKPQELRNQLTLLGKSILGRAIELTPMDTGTLRKSGVLLEFSDYIIVAFTAPYAVYVHENLEIMHPIHPGYNCGGRAKFLEIALQEFFPEATVLVNHLGLGAVAVKITLNDLINSMGIR